VYRYVLASTLFFVLGMPGATGWAAEEVSREQIKGLDEQVQEIKSDALGIAAELNRLEEKLLYPSNTQIAVFVTVATGAKLQLDAVELKIDGKPVAHHIYTLKEIEALQRGGTQRLYVGNVRGGEHALQVAVLGKSALGGEQRNTASFKVIKEVAPRVVGIVLGAPGAAEGIALKDL
jgi:hypothetical protein